MTLFRLGQAREEIEQALRAFLLQWETTCNLWMDQARADFGRTHVEPVGSTIRSYLQSLEELEHVIAAARRSVQ